MSFEVHVEVPIEELEDFSDEVVHIIDNWKKGIMLEIRQESRGHARKLAYERMPRGGSYARQMKWRDLQKGPKDYVSELYNDHQWAQAVEEGTAPHLITSDKLMTAKPVLAERGGKGRPWGMKYRKGAVYGYVFEHPGSRAFHIFRDTAKHIKAVSGRIVEKVFRRIRKRD